MKWFAAVAAVLAMGTAQAAVSFGRDVRPILVKRCVGCHNASDKGGGLSLANRADARRGGRSGPAVVPGDPDAGTILDAISGGHSRMGKRVAPRQIRVIRKWIEEGADWPDEN